jgi:hexosaminidase
MRRQSRSAPRDEKHRVVKTNGTLGALMVVKAIQLESSPRKQPGRICKSTPIRGMLLFMLAAILPAWCAADHNPLLPRPQEIRYGSGHLALRGMSICFASPPSTEDRFAAGELSRALSNRGNFAVPVLEGGHCGHGILLSRTGGVAALPVPGEHPGAQSREAYTLTVGPEGVMATAPSSAGLYYAVQTLKQLVEGSGPGAALPAVEIRDWPALAYRGVMVDMSHGALPTEDEVKRQLDFLARWKTNQYYFYSEASIELTGFRLINPEGRFSKEELRTIIAYGRERHIDVIPCLELFGHLHDLFRVEKYSDLSDMPHGTEFDPRNDRVMNLLSDWAGQIADLFPSPFVHIGFDETFQIEIAAQEHGAAAQPAELFVRQLTAVDNLFKQHGKAVMAWGDIMVKYPAIVAQLPPGLIAVAWEYDPGPASHYQHWLGPLAAQHTPHIIATGVTSWNQVMPDYARSFDNVDGFLAAGRQSGALGMMNTLWTDSAQNLLRPAWPGLAYGASAAWQSAPMNHQTFFPEYAQVMYGPLAAPEVAAALQDLAESELDLQKVLGDETLLSLWKDPFSAAILKRTTGQLADLRQTRLTAEDAEEHLDAALAQGGDPITLESLRFGARFLDFAGEKFQTAPELEEMWRRLGAHRPKDQLWWNEWESQTTYPDHSRVFDLMDAATGLRTLYRREWLDEYTPYRMDTALGRFEKEYQYWLRFQEKLQTFSDSTREGTNLPPLESLAH